MIDGSWDQDPDFGNYSTAVDTRSLSISLFPLANSSSLNTFENSTVNVALLYYENPNGKVSALLHRRLQTILAKGPNAGLSLSDQWIDITSQESKALPDEFRGAPGFNYNNTVQRRQTLNDSRTLYEAEPFAVYSTPFFSASTFFRSSVGAMFFSPSLLSLNTTSHLAAETFFL